MQPKMMSEGTNVMITTPGGTHASGNPLTAVAGARILEAPTPLKDEQKCSSKQKAEEAGNPARKSGKRFGAARRAARKQRLLAAGTSLQDSGTPRSVQTKFLRSQGKDSVYRRNQKARKELNTKLFARDHQSGTAMDPQVPGPARRVTPA
ncbi:uncharacterized protein LOC128922760 [Zeugodacus cucurbitae]|uniref:uncharacterized protein LOC128922760 n=1 Tax=Zeugodacus cucurbitae TaxID=28588 RepID=UPI0023D9403A|nr:uncharacterized protein LOC128922760 [Zeugodacus cucurbitae]